MPAIPATNGKLVRRVLRWLPLGAALVAWYCGVALLDNEHRQQAFAGLSEQIRSAMPVLESSSRAALVGVRLLLPRASQLMPDGAAGLEAEAMSLEGAMVNEGTMAIQDALVTEGTMADRGPGVESRRRVLAALTGLHEHAELARATALARGDTLKMLLLLSLLVLTGAAATFLRSAATRSTPSLFGELLFANSPVAVVISDTRDRIVNVNDAYVRMTGYAADEIVGQDLTFNHSGQQDESFFSAMRSSLASAGRWSGEFWLRNKGGEAFADKVTRLAISDDGGLKGYLTLSNDVVGTDDAQRLMLWQAHHDTLTKLPNRNLLQERLSRVLLRAPEDNLQGAVLSIDLDRFKNVNDSVGPARGDQVLTEAAYRIAMCVRESDTVARLGGDHFVVLLSEIEDYQEAERLARQIVEAMEQPFSVEGRELFVSASVGVAAIPQDGLETGELLQKADAARIQVKRDGGNNLKFFEPEMNVRAERRMELESALRKAVANGELTLFYQPVVDVKRGVVSSTEALLRWQHPELGMVSPGEFIPIAEDTGLIVEISQWVVAECQRQLKDWRGRGLNELRMSLNVSALQLRNAADVERLLGALEEGGADGLILELTESALIDNSEGAQQFLRGARTLGCAVALDDFGTGFSSLGYLRNFEFDVLKIDKTFIDELSNTRDYGLVASIVSMGRILGMKVVAEGVEQAEQVAQLKQIGCDYVQGYYYSKPLPAAEFQAFVGDGRLRDAG